MSSSPQIRATSRRRTGSVTTMSRWPWLNPADGVRCASLAIRSITSGATPPSSNRRTARRFMTTSRKSIGPSRPRLVASNSTGRVDSDSIGKTPGGP